MGGVASIALAVRPGAHRANVDMHELRDGIEADSAGVEREGSVPQLDRAYARDADVDGLGQHVLAVLGNAGLGAASAKEVVTPRRAVAADDVDKAVGAPERGHQRVEDVELLRIVAADVLRSMIAQKVIELVERLGNVGISHAIDDVDVFPGVEMV